MIFDPIIEFLARLFKMKCKDLPILKAPRLLKGKGCWIQKTSLDNPLINSPSWNWYVTDGSNMESEVVMGLKRNLFLSFSGKDRGRLCDLIDTYYHKLAGVIWDYEFGEQDRTKAVLDHSTVYEHCKKYALLYGIVTQADPEDSERVNSVYFKDSKKYCDFLMPMLYCQWWDCEPEITREVLCTARNEVRLPIVPVITLETTSEKCKRKITDAELSENYRGLEITGMCVWNVKDLDENTMKIMNTIL